MKAKTCLLAIFLTVAHVAHADTSADLPESKYVTEDTSTTAPKKDKTKLYNFLLATAAVVVATVAIIMVSDGGGHSHKPPNPNPTPQ